VSVAGRDYHFRTRRDPQPAPRPAPASSALAPSVRSYALPIIATACLIAMIWLGKPVLVPLLLSILISHALEPAVASLSRLRIPRALAVFVVLNSVVVGLGYGVYALGVPVSTFIDQMPSQAQRLRVALEQRTRNGDNPIDRVQQAANELERAANSTSKPAPAPAGVQRVRIEEPPLRLGDLAWRGSRGLIEFLAEVAVVFFLTYYLMLAGDFYRRKVARMAGPHLGQKRLALRIMRDVDDQIKRFLIARVQISAIVTVATGVALALLGMKQALMWGIVAGVLNVIPYIGPLAAIAAIAIAGFAQFGDLTHTGFVAGAAAVVAFLEGNVITPRLTGRAGKMNAVATFAGILFWGWMWGVWGMLLAVPIMTAMKAAFARIEGLRPVAELLSD
jgi:predicted PurR-regulated permease PerM